MNGLTVIIAGPQGSGKTTAAHNIVAGSAFGVIEVASHNATFNSHKLERETRYAVESVMDAVSDRLGLRLARWLVVEVSNAPESTFMAIEAFVRKIAGPEINIVFTRQSV